MAGEVVGEDADGAVIVVAVVEVGVGMGMILTGLRFVCSSGLAGGDDGGGEVDSEAVGSAGGDGSDVGLRIGSVVDV